MSASNLGLGVNSRLIGEIQKKHAKGGTTWEETTSFFVLESDLSATALCDGIYYGSGFIEDWDKMVVINLSVKTHAPKGKLLYPNTFEELMARR